MENNKERVYHFIDGWAGKNACVIMPKEGNEEGMRYKRDT